MKFLVEDVEPAFAAELRRIMISEVPTMAVQYAELAENDSGLFDEMLAHRVGLIPLTFDKKAFNLPLECKCEGKGCSQCQVTLVLDKVGPCTVFAKDMKSTDESVKPMDGNIIIAELQENQKLKFDAVASLGFGKDHAKHQAAIVGYSYYPKLVVNKDAEIKKLVSLANEAVEVSGEKVTIKDPTKYQLILAFEDESNGAVTLEGDPNRIIFTVESVSGLQPAEIFMHAVAKLDEKLSDFAKEVKKLK